MIIHALVVWPFRSPDDPPKSVEVQKEIPPGSLLAGGFDERSCLSRYQSAFYCKESGYKPSPYLISRLQSYEVLHKQCGPHSESYNKTLEQIKTGKHFDSLDCNYVWTWPIFSANHFPKRRGYFPRIFPRESVQQLRSEIFSLLRSLKNNLLGNSTPPCFYLDLVHDYDDQDKLFFCDQDQMFFKKVLSSVLAKADEKIGVQIRVFDTGPVHSNISGYYEKVRDIYWEQATMTGEVIGVYQPSNEGYQQNEKKMHNKKAWAEMYLLSLTDKLVASSWTTFGYVAQGLGGLKPWIFFKPESRMAPDPPCHRAMSMEPCFHAPPIYDCKKKRGIDTGVLVPHVRHCKDMSWGLKLVDRES
ncbi:hypothetical protein LguiA_028262 [Lonicera macranthoides]